MDSGQVGRVQDYRRRHRELAQVGVAVGVIVIIGGIILYFPAVVIGSMLVVLGSLRLWTLDLVSDQVLATRLDERFHERERADRETFGSPRAESSPTPEPSSHP